MAITVVMNAATLRPAEVPMNTGLGSAPFIEVDVEVEPGAFSLLIVEGLVVWREREEAELVSDQIDDQDAYSSRRWYISSRGRYIRFDCNAGGQRPIPDTG